jgi:hypothetical protein
MLIKTIARYGRVDLVCVELCRRSYPGFGRSTETFPQVKPWRTLR